MNEESSGSVLAGRLALDACRKGDRYPDHHWIFDDLTPFRGETPGGQYVDGLGALTSIVFEPHWLGVEQCHVTREVATGLPSFDEEYFEWIDIFEAAKLAEGSFTMLELGAGYGRWSVRGGLAARRAGIGVEHIHLGLAEAEPRHVEWLKQNLATNGLGGCDIRVFEAAIGGAHGEVIFCIGTPDGEDAIHFGQSVVPWDYEGGTPAGDYYGRPARLVQGGWKCIVAPAIPLSACLEPYEFIDLMDFDLQGAEADAIEEAIVPLTAKARRLHIGTHGKMIETRLRTVLGDAGWICVRDYSVGQDNDTPFGRLNFCDGVQSWINPRL